MKNTILSLTLSILTTIGLHAVDIQWQIDLPEGAQISYSAAGRDGSAVAVDSTNDTLFWIGPDGNIIETISNFAGMTSYASDGDGMVFVSSTQLLLPILDISNNFSVNVTKIVTKTESGYSIETLNGTSEAEVTIESSYPFFIIKNSNQLTLYKLDSNTSPSSYGVTTIPANAIVIPASHQGDVTISLEASSDLIEWNNVLPGSYSPTNEARFFRVKAVAEN